ncbi:MAG: NAD(P)/FAD-dependent oxidoreductase [Deltaproteobacteria bacterium]|uniref:NAD(P)/FAD-dependent oxidoreductase n=1 Tax=Candidatus Zymogenus saltonus TaxID=2844893 RepID=A0A9D8KIF0_9DELT|nr:NAD(P)/FAD-dependent oxidoreductase [Candidatus Zymogenus saltonus]
MRETYDLIIVGAGSGGCATAKTASERGLSVLLIDKRKREEIGDKLTFDTIPAYAFRELDIPYPEGNELDMKMEKLKVFSPNRKHNFEAPLDAYLTHRLLLGQRLLKYALDAGAELLPEADVINPIVEDNFLVGVRCRLANGSEKELRSKVTCDASGIRAVVRDALPKEVYKGEDIRPEDTVKCYREVRDLIGECDYTPPPDYPGWYCILQNRGYFWIVPEGDGEANVGCGLPLFADNPDPKDVTLDFFDEHPHIFGEEVYGRGTGPTPFIPMRADQPELVANGLVLVGEAGWQVATNSGFGVPGSIVAGKLAAGVAARAIETGDVSREKMWEYNVLWKRGQGAVRAFTDGIRLLVQYMDHSELNDLVRLELLGPKEFSYLWRDETFRYNIFEMAAKLFKGIGNVPLLMKVFRAYRTCVNIEKIYKKFPKDVSGFDKWKKRRDGAYKKLFKIVKK